jgi:ribonuclease P/MRP protein subunit RPP40
MTKRIETCLVQENWKNDAQHGFTKKRSTFTNMLEAYNNINEAINNKTPYDIIYIDFEKAFDKVDHNKLVTKLKSAAVNTEITNWISDFLSNRRFRTRVEDQLSNWHPITSGVPQGSVLSPLLFNIYVADLTNNLSSDGYQFADDAKAERVIHEEQDKTELQKDLRKIEEYCDEWSMRINYDKCAVLHGGKQLAKHQYHLHQIAIPEKETEKDLGIMVCKDLTWTTQCNTVAKKANRTIGLFRRTFGKIPADKFALIYKTYIRSLVEYGSSIWSPHLKKDKLVIENVQRRATRLAEGTWGLSYEQRLDRLKLTTLEARRKRGDLIECFKIMKGFYNLDKHKFWNPASTTNTRGHDCKIFKPQARVNSVKSFFTHRVVDEWNSLPQDVVDANSVNSFKNRLDKYVNYKK